MVRCEAETTKPLGVTTLGWCFGYSAKCFSYSVGEKCFGEAHGGS